MVARRHRVIAHGPQGNQLRGAGGGQGLDQGAGGEGAGGEVPGVYRQGVRMPRPLLRQGSGQAGKAAPLLPALLDPWEKAGVEVVGKEHRGFPGRLSFRRPNIQRQQAQQKHSRQQNPEKMALSSHAAPPCSDGSLVPGFILPQILQIRKRRLPDGPKYFQNTGAGGGSLRPPAPKIHSSLRICRRAFFSRRETWAWEMPISSDTSIWVLLW